MGVPVTVDRSRAARLSIDPVDAATSLVALVLVAVFATLIAKDGGYATTVWLPAALLCLLLAAVVSAFGFARVGKVSLVALGSLLALTLVMGISIAWAADQGGAWIGADRAFLYLVMFALGTALPWRRRSATLFLSGFGVAVTVVALWQFLRVAGAPVAHAGFFVGGRLATPISYPNADCGIFLMAAFPLLVLASRREVPLFARGLFLACVGVLVELALACQSRLSVVAAPLAVVLVVALLGGRVRLILTAFPVVVAVGLSGRRILDLYGPVRAGGGADALASARVALLGSLVALLIVGWAGAAFDERHRRTARSRRVILAAAVGSVVVFAVAGAAVVTRATPHPVSFVQAQWHAFVTGNGYEAAGTSHFTSIGTNRLAVWKVAARQFEAAPVGGVGADNFAEAYLRHRRTTSENALYPHSILLTVLSETGVVGAALLLVFLSSLAVGIRPAVGRGDPNSVLAIATMTPFLYFFVHGLGDWFWEIPALGAPALCFAGVALRLAQRDSMPADFRVPRVGIAAVVLVGVAVLGLPWLAGRETAIAATTWPQATQRAYDRLTLAARLDPLSDGPLVTEGLIAARAGDPARARRAFNSALGRNSKNWYSYLELAVADDELGNRPGARQSLERARELDPLEPLLEVASTRIGMPGRRLSQAFVDAYVAATDRATIGAG